MSIEGLDHISRGLYKELCSKVGTAKILDMRRRVLALEQRLKTVCVRDIGKRCINDCVLSGSTCEGFRFATSDLDLMHVRTDIRVIFSSSYPCRYTATQILLLAECEDTKPGFAMLKLFSGSTNAIFSDIQLKISCVRYMNNYYIASEKWREFGTSLSHGCISHGPCSTLSIGTLEVDHALCIKADLLPESAHGFIRRLHRAGWPLVATLHRIASSGCHFVAIGAKESATESLEWRISFSCAEKILIDSMNHVQFLCYGLLKIFLKEVIDINTDIKGLLCSYFLKTVVFWEITNKQVQWVPSTLLRCFWVCLQRLLLWINNEYCPNFFIPENNMFAGKIQGANRVRLLSYLVPLYQEGYSCLLRCKSIKSNFYRIIYGLPILRTRERSYSEKSYTDLHLIDEIYNMGPGLKLVCYLAVNDVKFNICCLDEFFNEYDEYLELAVLTIWKKHLNQILGMHLCSTSVKHGHDLIANSVFDATSHLLHAAISEYRNGNYIATLCLVKDAKLKLQNPKLMYTFTNNTRYYIEAGGDHKPFTQMMTEIFAWPIILALEICIPELSLEHHACSIYLHNPRKKLFASSYTTSCIG